MQKPAHPELAKLVHVTACATATWNGKEYDLNDGIHIEMGVVELWREKNPGIEFTVSDVIEKPLDARTIVNPLEENDRGEAFAGLKKRGRPSTKDGD